MTQQDNKMFQQIKNNSQFVDYLDRLESWICDIRNGDYSEETRKMTKEIIAKHLIDNMKFSKEKKKEGFFGNIGE